VDTVTSDKDNKNTPFNSMTRRQALRLMGTAALAAGGLSLGFPARLSADEPTKRPNVIFVLTDDHRWDMLGVTGHPFVKTPNMDRLANEGILFDNAFVTTSLCSPSRASFLTGQYASVHGVVNNFSPVG
jgi:hypothetical protein